MCRTMEGNTNFSWKTKFKSFCEREYWKLIYEQKLPEGILESQMSLYFNHPRILGCVIRHKIFILPNESVYFPFQIMKFNSWSMLGMNQISFSRLPIFTRISLNSGICLYLSESCKGSQIRAFRAISNHRPLIRQLFSSTC
jgi:hypothetical protein